MAHIPIEAVPYLEAAIYLPMLLVVLDKDYAQIEVGQFKLKRPYFHLIDEARKKAHADLKKTKAYLQHHQLKVVRGDSDELFTELRLQLDDQRNELKEQLQTIVASNDASASEKSDAYDEMEALNDAARKEMLLETLIKSKGFDDALVRADGNNVKITVKAKEHNASSANQIMTLVRDEMENMEDVIVTFEPAQ